MKPEFILLIIFIISYICYAVERRIAWLSHFSSACLIIMLAMVFSQIGLVPHNSTLYDFFEGPLILVAIVMITLSLQLKDIFKIPFKILIIFICGTIGTIFGGIIAGYLGSKVIGVDAYKIAAQLTASYIGGAENAAAMLKTYDIPKNYFVSVFAVDNIVTSIWLILSIWVANDKSKESLSIEDENYNFDGPNINIISVMACLSVSLGIVLFSQYVAIKIGQFHQILWMSIFALIAAQIPFLKSYFKSSYIIGVILFSGFFFSIGATSNLRAVFQLPPIIIAMPIIVVIIHSVIIISCAYFLKISKISTMVVSQALLGGPATAVSIAQARQWKNGISIGIILGVLGYSIANFFGIFVFNILQFINPK